MKLLSCVQGRRAIFGVSCSVALISAAVGPAVAGDDSKLEPTAHSNVKRMYTPASGGAATTAPAGAGGLIIYLDEQGRPTQDPSRINRRDAVQIPALNQSTEGLTTRPVTLKDGTTVSIVDLQGRFQSYAVGVVGADGQVRTGCIAPGDAAAQGKGSTTSVCQEKCCK